MRCCRKATPRISLRYIRATALACVERGDSQVEAKRLAERLLNYRVFGDGAGRLNRSVKDVDGELLLVSQFILAADTRKGTRPSLGCAVLVPGALPQYHPSAGALVMHGLGFT